MHEELQKYLDGEMVRTDLSRDALLELFEWQAMESALDERRRTSAPPHLVNNIMLALPPEPEHASFVHRALAWITTPRTIRVAPWVPATAFAAIAAIAVFGSRSGVRTAVPPTSHNVVLAAAHTAPVVYVQFALSAKGAHTVSVAGDFNNWSSETGMLRDSDGDGVWSGMIPVSPGTHKYMFVIDGTEWVTDPRADAYADDGFGMRNAVIGVTPPVTPII